MAEDLTARLRANNTWYDTAAADALEAQAKLIEKLEVNAVFWQKDALHTLKVKNEGDARIAKLEAALKPFAHEAQFYDHLYKDEELADEEKFDFTIGDLRAALAALEKKND